MSLCGAVRPGWGRCFPRVSGDEPADTVRAALNRVFSPRERG